MKNINLMKLKDLYTRYSILKKAYKNETDFKIKEGLKTTLIDLIGKIESEVGAPFCTSDKDLLF